MVRPTPALILLPDAGVAPTVGPSATDGSGPGARGDASPSRSGAINVSRAAARGPRVPRRKRPSR